MRRTTSRFDGFELLWAGLWAWTAAVVVLSTSTAVDGAAGIDPEDVKAALLVQAVGAEKAVAAAGGVSEGVVLLVHTDETKQDMEILAGRLARGKLQAKLVHKDTLGALRAPDNAVAAFMAKDVSPVAVAKLCQAQSLLSLTYALPVVRFGLISVGVGFEGKHPAIVVNKRRLRVEKRSLAKDFLSKSGVAAE